MSLLRKPTTRAVRTQEQKPLTVDDLPIIVKVSTPEGTTTHVMNPNVCYKLFRQGIGKFMGVGTDENPEARKTAALMRVAVKGILLTFGDKVLEYLLGRDHPRPGKHDDLIEWYTDVLARVGIAYAMKYTTTLEGHKDGSAIRIVEANAQPNTIVTDGTSPGSRQE